ncbi:MAG: histidine phosphatase family protein [Sporichthyaceae bacterium]
MKPGGLDTPAETDVVLVRHGEPERGLNGLDRADPWLSARGVAQARCLADALAQEKFDAVYSSPRRRAVDTAAPLCADRGITPVLVADLAEFDKHSAEYLFFEDLRAARDPRYTQCMAGDLSPWGTDFPSFRAEVTAALAEIVTAHPGGRILISTHGGVINVLLGAVLGLDRMWFFYPDHTGASRVAVHHSGRMRIVTVNERTHLRAVEELMGSSAVPGGAAPPLQGSADDK